VVAREAHVEVLHMNGPPGWEPVTEVLDEIDDEDLDDFDDEEDAPGITHE
jgi:hypothetical protein